MLLQSGSTLLLKTSTCKGHQCAVTTIIFLIILFRKKGAKSSNSCLFFFQVLAELKKLHFTLLNQTIEFDENGDPKFGSYDLVYWNKMGDKEDIGFYNFHPFVNFFINDSMIQWYNNNVSCSSSWYILCVLQEFWWCVATKHEPESTHAQSYQCQLRKYFRHVKKPKHCWLKIE